MSWHWNFYKILDSSEKKYFWGSTILNVIIFLIFILIAGYHFFASLLFMLMWQVLICLYYITKDRSTKKKGFIREWFDAIIFAVIAATLIRTFFVEAYTIPTSSMEKTLLIDDYLFVGKCNYGARLPITPLSVPFVHNQFMGGKSYAEWLQLPYMRLPALTEIKRNDIVVFNYPVEGDQLLDDFSKGVERPIDKKENYIKRCVGIPGDSLKVDYSKVFINGVAQPEFQNWQFSYKVTIDSGSYESFNGMAFSIRELLKLNINPDEVVRFVENDNPASNNPYVWRIQLHPSVAEKLKNVSNVISVEPSFKSKGVFDHYEMTYPRKVSYGWNRDFFGSIYIPKKGDKIKLDSSTYFIYEKCIRDYESNPSLEWKDGKALINNQPISEYNFTQNYYFMMGDNRHNSADSRYWGFVPEQNIVGKGLMIWFSWDKWADKWYKKVRWNRLFNIIHNMK